MKKKMLCLMLATIMLLFALPAYAISYSGGYSNPVRHYFLTGSLSKTSSQGWMQAADHSTESIKVYSDGTTANGYHYSRVTDANGSQLCQRKLVTYLGTATFSTAELGDYAISKNTLKLRIDNPYYDGDNTTIKLQTKGNFTATKTE